MGKISFLAGAGIGYVLGTRAGREQYDKLVAQAERVRRDPRVRQQAQRAQEKAGDLGQMAQDKVSAKMEESSSADGSGVSGSSTHG